MTFERMHDIPQRLPATAFILVLEHAFTRLPNCKTISLTHIQRPWGLHKLTAEELSGVQTYYELQKFKGRWFIRYLIGYIFTLSSKFGMENVEIFADKVCHKPLKWKPRKPCTTIGIYDICMARPIASSNLRSLKMTVNTWYRRWPDDAFSQLTSCFPQLSSLTLDFEMGANGFLVSSKFIIPGLKELTLCCKNCYPRELTDVIKRHGETLEHVAFQDVYLGSLQDWLVLMGVLCKMSKMHVHFEWLKGDEGISQIVRYPNKSELQASYREVYNIADLENDDDKRKMQDLLRQIGIQDFWALIL
jgi:hypothetical protein